MKILRIYILLLLGVQVVPESKAQIILNNNCQAFTDQPFFNPVFIKKNKIRSIRGKTSTKKEGDRIRETDIVQQYDFDDEGRVIKHMYVHHAFGYRTDTTTIIFTYDREGRLITKRQNDNLSFYSYNYTYDSLGNVIKETYCRDENCGPSKYQFKLGNQYEIIAESFSYAEEKNKKIKKYYNTFGKEYQQREYYFDEHGYLSNEKMIYTLTGRQTMQVDYTYNEQGLCTARSEFNVDGVKINTTYKYDKQGNLTDYDYMLDKVLVTHRELLYDQYMLLSASVSKDIRTNLITIIKYTYDFY